MEEEKTDEPIAATTTEDVPVTELEDQDSKKETQSDT